MKSIGKIFVVVIIVSLIAGMVALNYSYATSEAGYTPTGDTVYATETLNVRQSADSESEKIGSLYKNTSTKRISVGDNGWDKIEFNGGTGYVLSKYLTTQKPELVQEPKWTPTGDTVYSLKRLNVRDGCGTSYEAIGGLVLGQKITRIAVGDNGWDKIQYEGKEAYVMSQYLTTSKTEVDELIEEKENEEDENIAVEDDIDNRVDNTATESPETDEDVYNQIVDDIGVLPQVGKSIADYIYMMTVIVGIALTCFVGLHVNEKNEE